LPTVSLILVTYNRCDDINRTLATLKFQEGAFELVVVDNGSTTEGKNDRGDWRNVRFIRLNANGGAPGGRNNGIGLATGDLPYDCEELDLSCRVLRQGYRIVQASDLVVHHRVSPEARPMGRWVYVNARNRCGSHFSSYQGGAWLPVPSSGGNISS